MTDSAAAVMVKDMIRDCLEEAEPAHPGGDVFYGSMHIDGVVGAFADHELAMEGTAGFSFQQDGFLFLVHVHASRIEGGP